MNPTDLQQQKNIAIAIISLAKSELSAAEFAQLHIPSVQQFVRLACECISLDILIDPTLLRHCIHTLVSKHSVEEAVMQIFTLSIFRLCSEGSNHPLERGIIKQKIIGILPLFENAVIQGLIHAPIYDKNADALSRIADNTPDVPEILAALSLEYMRLKR